MSNKKNKLAKALNIAATGKCGHIFIVKLACDKDEMEQDKRFQKIPVDSVLGSFVKSIN